jgi:hypothetical protein
MVVCILKFKTLQMSCHVRRYTTLGMYKDCSLPGQDTLQIGGVSTKFWKSLLHPTSGWSKNVALLFVSWIQV